MKKTEIRKLISDYKEIQLKINKKSDKKLLEKLEEIEHKYFNELGRALQSDLKKVT